MEFLSGERLGLSEWTIIDPPDTMPYQDNGFDCGVFAVMYLIWHLHSRRAAHICVTHRDV